MKISPIIEVEYRLPAFFDALSKMAPQDALRVLQNFSTSLNALAEIYQSKWQSYAQGAPIPGTPRRINSRGPYVRSIKLDTSELLTKRIFTDYEFAEVIETGHDWIDLKNRGGAKGGLLYGAKARMGKHGAYNIVSFIHGTPSSQTNPMSKNVYADLRRMFSLARQQGMDVLSSVVSKGGGRLVTPSWGGKSRQLDVYKWGLRAGETGPRTVSKIGYTSRVGKQTGIVGMNTGSNRISRAQWRTFRTVSVRSPSYSWLVPPIKGVPIRQVVVDEMRRLKVAEQILSEAVERDIGAQAAQVDIK